MHSTSISKTYKFVIKANDNGEDVYLGADNHLGFPAWQTAKECWHSTYYFLTAEDAQRFYDNDRYIHRLPYEVIEVEPVE